MPVTCLMAAVSPSPNALTIAVWPSFWLQGTNWPDNGEVDIMEGQNLQSGNQVAIHTEGKYVAV
jgi:beta-glucanase (GH16 family)